MGIVFTKHKVSGLSAFAQKSISFVGIAIACVVPCAVCMDFDFWASHIFCLGVILASF